ncbi:MAG: hypothetical protein HY914_04060 [Desulfomonile tiedjei]|nr:hypothetical protein [Desulfomonile tiedjei]
MTFREEFNENIKSMLEARSQERDTRPLIESVAGEDDFAEWLACHERASQTVICNTPELRDTPFCGTGSH